MTGRTIGPVASLPYVDFRGTRLLAAVLRKADDTGTLFDGAIMPDNNIYRP